MLPLRSSSPSSPTTIPLSSPTNMENNKNKESSSHLQSSLISEKTNSSSEKIEPKVTYGKDINETHYKVFNRQVIAMNKVIHDHPEKKLSVFMLIAKAPQMSDKEIQLKIDSLNIKDLNPDIFISEIRHFYRPKAAITPKAIHDIFSSFQKSWFTTSQSSSMTGSIRRILQDLGYNNNLDRLFEAVITNNTEDIILILKEPIKKFDLSYLLIGANLSHVNLRGIPMFNINFTSIDFSHAHLNGTEFKSTILKNANFSHAKLNGTDFIDCDLTGEVNFFGADLCGANFSGAKLDMKAMSKESQRTLYKHLASIKNLAEEYQDYLTFAFPEDSRSSARGESSSYNSES